MLQQEPQEEDRKMRRFSVSIPIDDYKLLEAHSKKLDVSVAWVVRAAIRDYLDADTPLLKAAR